MTSVAVNRRKFIRSTAKALLVGPITARWAAAAPPVNRPNGDHLKRLIDWVLGAMVHDGIELLANLPSGVTRAGRDRTDLKRLCWLQNCNLFGFHALREFEPATAATLEASYRRWYREAFSDVEERTENYLPIGGLPAESPPEGKFYRTVIEKTQVGDYTIGTETYRADWLGTIFDDDPRGLLKFGALGSQLRGDRQQARLYFKKALALWDGTGFRTPRRTQHDAYYTRYLAYALIVERALHERIPPRVREAIQERLWALQDKDGGLWANYSRDGTIPGIAKKTTEIGPLTLLAYSERVWP